MPVARHLVETVAVSHGVCVHPVPVRRIEPASGASEIVDVPCAATLESKCPPCATRARSLRITQCRTGWHLDEEPVFEPDEPSEQQVELTTLRADLEAILVQARAEGQDEALIVASIERVEAELSPIGSPGEARPVWKPRRVRSTKRRQDVPDLPTRTRARSTGARPSVSAAAACW